MGCTTERTVVMNAGQWLRPKPPTAHGDPIRHCTGIWAASSQPTEAALPCCLKANHTNHSAGSGRARP